MTKHEEAARRQRRNFLKAAGGAAMGLVAQRRVRTERASKPVTNTDRLREAPPDRGVWITWYDLPMPDGTPIFPGCSGRIFPDC